MTDTGTAVALTPAAQDRALPPAPLSGMPALSRFGIPLGLAGPGGGWSAAARVGKDAFCEKPGANPERIPPGTIFLET